MLLERNDELELLLPRDTLDEELEREDETELELLLPRDMFAELERPEYDEPLPLDTEEELDEERIVPVEPLLEVPGFDDLYDERPPRGEETLPPERYGRANGLE